MLASHSKRWKEVMHSQSIKTDEKDAGTITDLVAIGQFVSFPFLKKEYAELRYLVSARDNVSIQRTAALTRLKSVLQVVWPEFEKVFPKFQYITPLKVSVQWVGEAQEMRWGGSHVHGSRVGSCGRGSLSCRTRRDPGPGGADRRATGSGERAASGGGRASCAPGAALRQLLAPSFV